jgi:hypothetical protein
MIRRYIMSFGSAPSYTPPAAVDPGLTAAEKAAQEAATAAEKARVRARKGFSSTLLAGDAQATTVKKTLLGE